MDAIKAVARALALVLALAVAFPVWGQAPPRAEFKGVAPGATEAQWHDAFPFFVCAGGIAMV